MNSTLRRALPPAAVLFVAAFSPAGAQQQPVAPPAQQQPPQPQAANPYCGRLEAQLAAFDRSNPDAARAEQVRKLEDAAKTQESELARQEAAAKRMGCEQNSFFVLFSRQPEQCGPLTNRIKQLQANLEATRSNIERSQGDPPPEREGQRRALLGALVQNNCGPQYQAALGAEPSQGGGSGGGLFETLFGGKPPVAANVPAGFSSGGNYRTVCVRTCDGFYWPISYSATPAKFNEDEKTCRQSCPAAEATLFAFPNQGGDMSQAISISGQPYGSLPNAYRYRQALDQSCSCRRPGESWSQALKNLEDGTVEQGDIVVNEQRARQMSQPRVDAHGRPIRPEPRPAAGRVEPKAAQPVQTAAPPAPSAEADSATASTEAPDKPDPNRKVRSVGPTFIPRAKSN